MSNAEEQPTASLQVRCDIRLLAMILVRYKEQGRAVKSRSALVRMALEDYGLALREVTKMKEPSHGEARTILEAHFDASINNDLSSLKALAKVIEGEVQRDNPLIQTDAEMEDLVSGILEEETPNE